MVHQDNLFSFWNDAHFEFYQRWTLPFLEEHTALAAIQPRKLLWSWVVPGAAERCLDDAWAMTGRWRARRGALVDRGLFDATVPGVVRGLAATFNRSGVRTLRDLCELRHSAWDTYSEAMGEIHAAVQRVSEVKPTKVIQPVFGSKVLHHYFPSVIPVFDMALVQRGVMALEEFSSFIERGRDGWQCWDYTPDSESEPRERVVEDFRRYLDFALAELSEVPAYELAALREAFGAAMEPGATPALRRNRESLLWCLDAKVVEWSLCGAAYQRGLIR